MKLFYKIASGFVLSIILLSCDDNKVFEDYIEVESADWKKVNIGW